ncbi:hypothetical protein KKA85_07995 [bacterium]|nr:hypothetical protein [bacterium]MBU1675707.1 hypothetical protein [bacterium]
MSLPAARIPILLIGLMTATASLAAGTAAPDSSRAVEAAATAVAAAVGDAETPALPGSAWGALPERAEAQPPPDDDEQEKERVPKKKVRRKGESRSASDDDDDSSCFSSCLEGVFISMLTSSDEDEDEEETGYVEPPALVADEPEPAPGDTLQERTYAQYVDEPAPEKVFTPAAFGLVLDLSWWRSGPSDVWNEYRHGGGRFGVGGNFLVGGSAEIGIDAAFSWAKGYPLYDYETSTRLESPQISHLWLLDVGLRAGTIHNLASGGLFLRWGLGPRVYRVKESADLDVYELPGPTDLTYRKETLSAWRLGGDLLFSMLWHTEHEVFVGFSARFFVIPWESAREKSLTLDYIGRKSLVGFSLGLAVQFNGL